MPQQTTQQLQNALNPTPVTYNIPTSGLWRKVGDNVGDSVFRTNLDGTITQFNLATIGRQAGATGPEVYQVAKQILKDQYGLDFWTLPEYNYGDILQVGQRKPGFTVTQGTLTELAQPQAPTQSTGVTVNTQSNQLGDIAASRAAEQQQLASTAQNAGGTTNTDIQALQANTSLATSGNYARTPNGIVDLRTGQVVAPAQTTVGAPSSPGAPDSKAQLQSLLSNPNLSADQRTMIQQIFNAVSTNDSATASRLAAAMQAGTQFSDPYFKAQRTIALDALTRAFQAQEGDLSFNEGQLNISLESLRRDIASANDTLSLDEQAQLRQLEQKYQSDLENTQNDLASRGFTASSVRSKAEGVLNTSYGDIRESTKRSFANQLASNNNKLSDTSAATAAQIANLRRLAEQGKIAALRTTEGQIGSTALTTAGYSGGLGNIGGDIPRAQALDAIQFANGFVF